MKKLLTRALSLLMVMLIIATVFTAAPMAIAAEAGTLSTNPIILVDGVYHTKWWTSSNYRLNCYNKIEVPSRGYITFTIEKPTDSEGEIGSFDLYLYKPDNTIAWAADTADQKDGFSTSYVYKIGLDAGTYYMNIDPSFYIHSGSAPIESSYVYEFTADNYWEIEPNNTVQNATVIPLNTMYSGIYTDESYDISYLDYFGFDLTAGKEYRIKIENYAALDAGTLIEKFLSPSGAELSMGRSSEDVNAFYWDVTAETTGRHYMRFDNDGNDAGTPYKIGVYELNHISDNGTITTQPTVSREGEKTFKCTVCGKTLRTEKVAKLSLKPTNIKIKAKTKSVTITWDNIEGVSYYDVYWRNTSTGWTRWGSTSTNKFTGKSASAAKYEIKVVAKYGSQSSSSNPVDVVTKPLKGKLNSLYAGSKSLTAYWKTESGVDGYEVYYSTSKKFASKNTKKKIIKKSKSYKVTLKKLKSKKKYYVKVRAFMNSKGKKVYGAWSKVMTVKVR